MSVRALTWSFNLMLQDMAGKAALHALADHADEEGRCWPSVARVAQCMGCHEKTARKALARLADLGVISREPRSGRSDVFTIDFDWAPSQKRHPSQKRPLPQQGTTPLPNQSLTPPPAGDHTPPLEGDPNRQEPSKKNRQGTVKAREADERIRLAKDWKPIGDDHHYAADKGLDPETSGFAFCDYFTEGRGRNEKRTLAGWSRRWRIWCNTDAERKGPNGKGPAAESWNDRRIRLAMEAIK